MPMRRYRPDFIVLVDDGRGPGDPLHLVVEIKGCRREDAKEKKATPPGLSLTTCERMGSRSRAPGNTRASGASLGAPIPAGHRAAADRSRSLRYIRWDSRPPVSARYALGSQPALPMKPGR